MGICVLDNDAGLLLQQMENQAIQSICEYLLSNGINLPHLMEKTQIAYHIIEEYCHDVMLEKYYQTHTALAISKRHVAKSNVPL